MRSGKADHQRRAACHVPPEKCPKAGFVTGCTPSHRKWPSIRWDRLLRSGDRLALRPSVGLDDTHPVFATYRAGHAGHPVSPQAARATIKRLGQRAAIRKHGPVHPHLLRHTLAHEMRKAGCDLYAVMRQLGHASIKTTETYLAGLSARDLAQTLRKVR